MEKFSLIDDLWNPRIIGELNGQQVKLAKVKRAFVSHHHETEEELFFVVKGTLRMVFQDREVVVKEGEMIIVPAGVEHRPIADEETHLLLFEPASTLNTGNAVDERTREKLTWI